MKINRKDLLNALQMVESGISRTDTILQSSCVVMRRGWFYTLSREIACAMSSGLPIEIDAAIKADKLIDVLRKIKDEEVFVTGSIESLSIKGSGRSKLTLEADVTLPVDMVERPAKTAWQKLAPDFAEAVDLAVQCTRRKDDRWIKTCVHITSDWIEASDDNKMIRYPIKTFVTDPILVRGTSIKTIIDLGMTVGAETEYWLHFRNPLGLRVSVQKFPEESYPDLSLFAAIRGRRIVFPKTLSSSAEIAEVFTDEEKGIKISLAKRSLVVYSRNSDGEYEEAMDIEYEGDSFNFQIPPKLIAELVSKFTECEITESTIRVDGKKFVYVAALGVE